MPRLKKTAVQAHEEELAMKDRTLTAVIDKNRALCGMRSQDVAEAIRMPYSTYMDRRRHPQTWRRGELIRIFEVLQVPEEDKRMVSW